METRYINTQNPEIKTRQGSNFWEVMKPFAKFGLKSLGIMAGAMWAIIKIIPKPSEFKPEKKPY